MILSTKFKPKFEFSYPLKAGGCRNPTNRDTGLLCRFCTDQDPVLLWRKCHISLHLYDLYNPIVQLGQYSHFALLIAHYDYSIAPFIQSVNQFQCCKTATSLELLHASPSGHLRSLCRNSRPRLIVDGRANPRDLVRYYAELQSYEP